MQVYIIEHAPASGDQHLETPPPVSHNGSRLVVRFLAPFFAAAAVIASRTATAQDHAGHSDALQRVALGAQAIGLLTRQSPALSGEPLTEGYLTQPTLMAHANLWRNVLSLQLMLSLEGLTLERGELNPGMVGEGYIDRRHPHTYLHELTTTVEHGMGATWASLTVGKGFAPFGTDDPMVRPFVKYPINHHLAQILERVVAVAAVRAGPISLEAGAFNGDEPESAGDAPNRDRLWDSWAARATLAPVPTAEIQVSFAKVRSPELASGGGPDDRKWSASARYEAVERRRYALAEWARTTHYVGSSPTYAFSSFLAEAESAAGRFTVAGRLEVSERPDEERSTNPFRTPLGGHDFSILGRTRWTIASARVAAPLTFGSTVRVVPFVELAHHGVRETLRPSGFSPAQFYGSDRIWTVSVGAKAALGAVHGRMGRYGAAIIRPRGISVEQPESPPHAH
jgi:hypothetical protein